jgi:hypothetical protein
MQRAERSTSAETPFACVTVIEPLRRLGVPATAIVDIDVLKEGGTVWSNFLKGANIPEITRKGLESTRANLGDSDWYRVRAGKGGA